MRRLILFFVFLFPLAAIGQSTTVSGTLVDINSVVWANATITATLTPSPGVNPASYVWSGGALNQHPSPVTADNSGNFSISLPSTYAITPTNSTWTLLVCPTITVSCARLQIPLYGGSINVSSALTPLLPTTTTALQIPIVYVPAQIFAPKAGQIIYNLATGVPNFFNGTIWSPFAGGGSGAVSSVFGRTGTITAQNGDYSASQITGLNALAINGLTVTATGSSGPATLTGTTLNIPQYSSSGGGNVNSPTGINQILCSNLYPGNANWQACNFIWLQNGNLQNWYQPPQSTMGADGTAYNLSQSNTYNDYINFSGSFGNAAGWSAGEWYQSQGHQDTFNFMSNGIKQAHLRNITVGAPGDTSIDRDFINILNGGCVSASDECQKTHYISLASIATYKGYVSAVSGTGATEVRMTSAGNSCSGGQNGNSNCLASGLMLMRTTTPIYSNLVVSLMTQPTPSAPGVMTLSSGTVTPSAAIATISTTFPTVTNRQTGITVTGITPTVVSGTIPVSTAVGSVATQQACLFNGVSNTAESHYYLWSGSGTLTLLHHREPSAGQQTLYFGGPCMSIVDLPDQTLMGSSMNFYYLGAFDSTHILYTSYIRGAADNPMYHTGFAFSPGVAGKDTINVYSSAKILGTSDPTLTTPGPYNPTGSSATAPNTYAVLTENSIPWAVGDSIEAPMEPASQIRMYDEYMNIILPSSVSTNVLHHTELNGRVDGLRELVWNAKSTFGYDIAGSGSIYNWLQSTFTPTHSVFEYSGCPAGGTGNCSNSLASWMFHVAPAGLGWLFDFPNNRNAIYGPVLFQNVFASPSGSTIGGVDPTIPENILSSLPPAAYNPYQISQIVRQTDAVIGSECSSGTGTDTGYHVLCESYSPSYNVYAYRLIGIVPIPHTGTLTGSSNAAACLNSAGQIYRSTSTTCP